MDFTNALLPPVIMILRVYALYGRSTLVVVPLLSLLAVQISTSSIGLHTGFGRVKILYT